MKPVLEKARNLRRDMSDAETILWSRVRNRSLAGLKFKRQVPVGKYIVDFLIDEAKLIVELDGEQHAYDHNAEYDQSRDAYLRGAGYEVVRFWNEAVYRNLDNTLEQILRVATERIHAIESADPSPETAAQFRPLPRER